MIALALIAMQAAAPAADPRLRRAEAVLTRFAAAVERCGRTPPYVPTVRLTDRPGFIHYNDRTHEVVMPSYESMAAADRAAWDRSAAGNRLKLPPAELYALQFHELIVAHELGHWIETIRDRKLDDWSSEYMANRIMVAFWREDAAAGRDRMRRLQSLVRPRHPGRSPVPAAWRGTVEAYFNAHRMDVVRAGGYGWIQTLQTQRAVAERPRPTFCSLLATYWRED